jgi:GT2 family glycosyltransferase
MAWGLIPVLPICPTRFGSAMKLSVIVATRNRSHAVAACLDSIAAALAKAAPLDAEIIIVDNGSTDDTAALIEAWRSASNIPVKALSEPLPGKGRALNRALRSAQGELLAFTDDDCRLHVEHVNDLLRYASADRDLVLRGGRIELGDPDDFPFTINIEPTRKCWSLAQNSARHDFRAGQINGCNMTMRRALYDRVGPFDEDFGPGSKMGSGEDTDFMFKAYLAGTPLEYVPDMTVYHHHGRRTAEAGRALWRKYMIGSGGIYAKYVFKHPALCRIFLWDIRCSAIEIFTRSNTFLPEIGFSHKQRVACSVRGLMRYAFMRKGWQRSSEAAVRVAQPPWQGACSPSGHEE